MITTWSHTMTSQELRDTQATTDTAQRAVHEAKALRAELTRQPTTTSLRDAVEWANTD